MIFLRLLHTYIIISRSLIVTDCCHEQNCYGLVETKLKMLLEMVLFKEGILNCRKHLLLRGLN